MFLELANNKEKIISWRWSSSEGISVNGIAIMVISLLMDSFIVIILVDSAISSRHISYGPPFFIILFFVFVANSLAVIYILSRTEVTITSEYLTVRHKPLPWFPAPTLKTSKIQALEISERIEWGYVDREGRVFLSFPIVVYKLVAVMANGAKKTLFHGPRKRQQAEFLRDRIADGINDLSGEDLIGSRGAVRGG